MHSKLPLALSIAALVGVTIPSVSAQTPVIYYDFNSDLALSTGSSIDNKGSGGTDGTFNTGTNGGNFFSFVTSGAPGPSGNALQLTPGADNYQNMEPAFIDTGFALSSLNITPSTGYTTMAWLNFANAIGDNMVFGGAGTAVDPGREVLHNGTRNGNLHSGHWGDDLGPDQGVNVSSLPGTWHHVAYTNETGSGLQSIYFDGNLVAGPAGSNGVGGAMDVSKLLLIGTSNNGGSFNGLIDEVKVFDSQLSQAQIQAASVVVPEPTSLAVMMLSGLGVFALRRRR
jgi:hypothetical protein